MKKLYILAIITLFLTSCTKIYIEDNDQQMDSFFYVNFKGSQMPVLVEGNISSKKFIVVVHGGPGGAGMSYIGIPAFEKLEEDYAVVYYNQRASDGTTALGNDNTERSRAQYAEDITAILNTLKHKYGDDIKFYLMGHSWGGELVTEFMSTAAYQEMVEGMINVSGGLRLSDTERERNLYMRELIMQIAQIEIAEGENLALWNEIYDYCVSVDTNNIDEYGLGLWSYGWPISWDYLVAEGKITFQEIPGFESYDQAPNLANGYGSASGQLPPYGFFISDNPADQLNPNNVSGRVDQTNSLPKITKPSLIIAGKYDCVVPPKLSQALFNGISTPLTDKTYVEMDSTSHGPYDRGVDFYNLVHAFVAKY
jgi:pimeloyl-ACP methyl ester carboxylesterase